MPYRGYYYWFMRVRINRNFKRFLTVLIAVNVGLLVAPSNSQSAETVRSDFIEWTNGFNWLNFGLTGSHAEIQRYFPWYKYDLDNSPYISIQAPVSIRIPSAIKLDFSQRDCINLPIKVRREVPRAVTADSLNILNVDFFLSSSKSKTFEINPIFTLGPTNWLDDISIIEIQIPVCKNSILDPNKSSLGTYLSLGFTLKYSRDLASLSGETSKCKEFISDKCVITDRASTGISIVSNVKQNPELIELYETSIKNSQDFIDTKPGYPGGVGNQLLSPVYCVNAGRNIQILKNELLAIQAPAFQKPSVNSSTKKTITCIKGKATKKVTAVNPKCPTGYKKK